MTITETEPRFVPVQTRSERFKSTDVADFDAVTGREATWRYTPVAQIAALLEPGIDGSRYDVQLASAGGVTTAWVARDHALVGTAGQPEERASANAWSSFDEALLVTVAGDAGEATLTRSALGAAPRAAHTVIHALAGSSATLILRNAGEATITENVEVVLEQGAQLTLVSVQEWADDARQVSTHFASVGRDAHLKHVLVTLGGAFVRLNPSVHLAGPGAEIEAYGAYFADAGQYIEHQVYVFHDEQHQRSRVTYKGALQGASAHTVWIGDVLIGQNAVGTDSYEQNRNLVLTEGARADSVPNLEIELGDILGAGHASATGRFDDEQLFYLQSRGITEDEARRLVVRGFLVEIVQQIGSPELEEHLQQAIEAELAGGER
ncbi:Fe-S cluster assembly protein SufD [Humibacter ginsenosidimutans]|uniref:Fe-S cluster assembly protein SufD n=1 Tax=Humibacter ginsenosidimutans TaxID=2599293 RepID=A0A5B8M055_9MICO|nr:Fe-S cluster assembly protein SufD [Humibacter ginsenosidimutans]QDZ13763.1 Fe-S cluster assembly protein SufD [Humibacter ginsenosidimutans]